jgi:hypothetical protein
MNVYFLKDPLWTVNGSVPVPFGPRSSMELESEDLLEA